MAASASSWYVRKRAVAEKEARPCIPFSPPLGLLRAPPLAAAVRRRVGRAPPLRPRPGPPRPLAPRRPRLHGRHLLDLRLRLARPRAPLRQARHVPRQFRRLAHTGLWERLLRAPARSDARPALPLPAAARLLFVRTGIPRAKPGAGACPRARPALRAAHSGCRPPPIRPNPYPAGRTRRWNASARTAGARPATSPLPPATDLSDPPFRRPSPAPKRAHDHGRRTVLPRFLRTCCYRLGVAAGQRRIPRCIQPAWHPLSAPHGTPLASREATTRENAP